jgi:hypothetical protein
MILSYSHLKSSLVHVPEIMRVNAIVSQCPKKFTEPGVNVVRVMGKFSIQLKGIWALFEVL